MDNAKLLFDKLSLKYIKEEMINKEFENNWLEGKEKQKPKISELSETDTKNFAKALSGFANTSGGVLIFGLKAKKKDDVDEIQEIKPIEKLKKFESRLRELESRKVERLVKGVDYKKIETSKDKGIIAVYIPESDTPPHRSLFDYKFYLRAGGTFNSIDIKIIEDLFHESIKPILEFTLTRVTNDELRVVLKNIGKGIAKYPSFVVTIPPEVSIDYYGLDGNRPNDIIHQRYYRDRRGKFAKYSGGIDKVVYANGGELPIGDFKIANYVAAKGKTIEFEYFLDAENMQTSEGKYLITL